MIVPSRPFKPPHPILFIFFPHFWISLYTFTAKIFLYFCFHIWHVNKTIKKNKIKKNLRPPKNDGLCGLIVDSVVSCKVFRFGLQGAVVQYALDQESCEHNFGCRFSECNLCHFHQWMSKVPSLVVIPPGSLGSLLAFLSMFSTSFWLEFRLL